MYATRLSKLEKHVGSTKDMIYVSWCLIHGDETSQDIGAGVNWLVKAATMGDAEARIRLAGYFEEGVFVERDCIKAMHWYAEAQKINSIYGPYAMALAYYFGSPCFPRDEAKATLHFSIAAARGHLISKAQLARIYRAGGHGFIHWALGYLIPIDIVLRSIYRILSRDMNEAFWDYERWQPKTARIAALIKNTHFDSSSKNHRQ